MSKTNLDMWLRTVGFSENPFGMWEAGSEAKLSEYFVEPPYFDEILGEASKPRSAIMAAERGCGKSANRRMIEYHCSQERVGSRILAISFTDFTRLAEASTDGKMPVTIQMHVQEIIRQGLRPLLEWICQRVSTDVLRGVTTEHWSFLRCLLVRFNPFFPYDVERQLKELGIESPNVVARLRNAVMQEPDLDGVFYTDLLRRFLSIAWDVGADAVYILVDGVDELSATSADPNACVALIEPLISNLYIMEFPRLAFKFFLTPAVAQIVRSLPTVRSDRLVFRHVVWSEPELTRLLRMRLESFSERRVSSLDGLCSADLHGLDAILIQNARGSPRNMLRLGYLVLSERARLATEGQELLTRADLEAGLRRFASETAIPSIQVNPVTGELRVQGKLVPLTPFEGKLFALLYEKRGMVCRKEDLLDALYKAKDKSALGAFDQVLSRLRESLEENESTRSIGITTVRGRGLRLDLAAE